MQRYFIRRKANFIVKPQTNKFVWGFTWYTRQDCSRRARAGFGSRHAPNEQHGENPHMSLGVDVLLRVDRRS